MERLHKGAGHPVSPMYQPSIKVNNLERPHKGAGHLVSPTSQTFPSNEPPCHTSSEAVTGKSAPAIQANMAAKDSAAQRAPADRQHFKIT